MGLPPSPPPGPPRGPPAAAAALDGDDAIVLDGRAALFERLADLESIVLRGELPPDVVLADDDALPGVVGHLFLYAARLGAKLSGGGGDFAARIDDGVAALVDDATRREWALRELPGWTVALRELAEALPEDGGALRVAAPSALDAGELVPPNAPGKLPAAQAVIPLGVDRSLRLPRASTTELPLLGLGTCWLTEAETEESVVSALTWAVGRPTGPRVHVDSAEAYLRRADYFSRESRRTPAAAAWIFRGDESISLS